jgi:hypothetical protein
MAKFFRLEEAAALLPRVADSVGRMVYLKQEYDRAEGELQATTRRVQEMGGMMVDRPRMMGVRNKRDATAARLNEVIAEVTGMGVEVKDLDMGLIDFPSLYRGEEVCLCWKFGEKAIEFWHRASEGYRGRKAIDEEFLENHHGDEGD